MRLRKRREIRNTRPKYAAREPYFVIARSATRAAGFAKHGIAVPQERHCRREWRGVLPSPRSAVNRQSRQPAGNPKAASHLVAAGRAHLFGARSRAIRRGRIGRCGDPIGQPKYRRRIRKSALGARSCGRFCPGNAVDSRGAHDKLEKTEKMHNFSRFGVFRPSNQACERPSGTCCAFPTKDLLGANTGNEVERDAKFGAPTRAVMGGFLMQHPRASHAKALSAGRRSLANCSSADRFGSAGRDRPALSPRSGMSVAGLFVIRVADPSALPGNEEAV